MANVTFIPGWGFRQDIWETIQQGLSTTYANHSNHILIGWSLGGMLALKEYATRPDHYSHLILIGSTPRFIADHDWHGLSQEQAEKQFTHASCNMVTYQHQFLRLALHPDKAKQFKAITAQYMQQPTTTLLNELNTLFTLDLRDTFANCKIPILQIIGEHDLVTRPAQSIQAKKLRDHQINIVPNAGHMLLLSHYNTITTMIREYIC